MMMTQEEAIFKAQAQVDELIDFVRQASAGGRTIDPVERNLWERLLAVGRAMLEGYVAGFDAGDLGPTLAHEGRSVRRLEERHLLVVGGSGGGAERGRPQTGGLRDGW